MVSGDYYVWREWAGMLGGESVRWCGKPGLAHWDTLAPGAQLLVENALPPAGQALLDLRCGTGVAGALAAKQGARVTLCDDSLVAVEAARRTLALYGFTAEIAKSTEAISGVFSVDKHQSMSILSGAARFPSTSLRSAQDACRVVEGCGWANILHGASDLPPAAFDVAWLAIPRGRAWVKQLLAQAGNALKPEGVLYVVGPTQGGIKSALDDAAEMGWTVRVVSIKRRHRLAVCTRKQALGTRDQVPGAGGKDGEQEFEVMCRGEVYRCASAPGVFAQGALDAGTRALIEAMQIRPGQRVLDLGCGCGIVGLAAARLGAQVCCVDHSAAAIETTRRTLALNGINDAVVLASDCAQAPRAAGMQFDIVATNPPFHQGIGVEYEVAQQFIRDAAAALAPGGTLYLVANRFIRYDGLLGELFGAVETVYADGRYRVLRAKGQGNF